MQSEHRAGVHQITKQQAGSALAFHKRKEDAHLRTKGVDYVFLFPPYNCIMLNFT